MSKNKVAILMSTFNGGIYLEEQLESLKNQTYSDFTLYVRDDGSSDNTVEILNSFDGLRVDIIQDDLGNIGPAFSFMKLLSIVEADYYFFCDQDDVWFDEKIQRSLENLIRLGGHNDIPALCHSDLVLVDKDLAVIGPTFHQFDNVSPRQFQTNHALLIQNCVVGCTSAFNRKLRDIALNHLGENVKYIAMHDWWLALYARYFGILFYDASPTIFYRQHQANVSGSSINNRSLLSRATSLKTYKKVSKMLQNISHQTRCFVDVVQRSDLELPKEAEDTAKLALQKSIMSYITLFFKGVRFSNPKLTFAVIVYVFLAGRWL